MTSSPPTPRPTVHHVPETTPARPGSPAPRQVVHRTRAAVRPSAEPSARRSGAQGQPQLPLSLRPPAPPEAVALLSQANRGLDHAENERDPAERFIGAYLAALRGAGAVLAVRGRPRRSRPASGWVLLDAVAPELREWSAFFAANSETRAAAEAGITGRVDAELAAGLLQATAQFLELVRRVVHGLPMSGEAHVA
ncbi:SAV_6107 family HEPN domain-containing protein [Amycolatopsis sp. WGS_07]|uniref:SAV_6107 family HEPN domain-containing protein n=1 Tax=Amycolatopsis sp. WGS_07 TaxID=3076764 RepID=UPI0038732432